MAGITPPVVVATGAPATYTTNTSPPPIQEQAQQGPNGSIILPSIGSTPTIITNLKATGSNGKLTWTVTGGGGSYTAANPAAGSAATTTSSSGTSGNFVLLGSTASKNPLTFWSSTAPVIGGASTSPLSISNSFANAYQGYSNPQQAFSTSIAYPTTPITAPGTYNFEVSLPDYVIADYSLFVPLSVTSRGQSAVQQYVTEGLWGEATQNYPGINASKNTTTSQGGGTSYSYSGGTLSYLPTDPLASLSPTAASKSLTYQTEPVSANVATATGITSLPFAFSPNGNIAGFGTSGTPQPTYLAGNYEFVANPSTNTYSYIPNPYTLTGAEQYQNNYYSSASMTPAEGINLAGNYAAAGTTIYQTGQGVPGASVNPFGALTYTPPSTKSVSQPQGKLSTSNLWLQQPPATTSNIQNPQLDTTIQTQPISLSGSTSSNSSSNSVVGQIYKAYGFEALGSSGTTIGANNTYITGPVGAPVSAARPTITSQFGSALGSGITDIGIGIENLEGPVIAYAMGQSYQPIAYSPIKSLNTGPVVEQPIGPMSSFSLGSGSKTGTGTNYTNVPNLKITYNLATGAENAVLGGFQNRATSGAYTNSNLSWSANTQLNPYQTYKTTQNLGITNYYGQQQGKVSSSSGAWNAYYKDITIPAGQLPVIGGAAQSEISGFESASPGFLGANWNVGYAGGVLPFVYLSAPSYTQQTTKGLIQGASGYGEIVLTGYAASSGISSLAEMGVNSALSGIGTTYATEQPAWYVSAARPAVGYGLAGGSISAGMTFANTGSIPQSIESFGVGAVETGGEIYGFAGAIELGKVVYAQISQVPSKYANAADTASQLQGKRSNLEVRYEVNPQGNGGAINLKQSGTAYDVLQNIPGVKQANYFGNYPESAAGVTTTPTYQVSSGVADSGNPSFTYATNPDLSSTEAEMARRGAVSSILTNNPVTAFQSGSTFNVQDVLSGTYYQPQTSVLTLDSKASVPFSAVYKTPPVSKLGVSYWFETVTKGVSTEEASSALKEGFSTGGRQTTETYMLSQSDLMDLLGREPKRTLLSTTEEPVPGARKTGNIEGGTNILQNQPTQPQPSALSPITAQQTGTTFSLAGTTEANPTETMPQYYQQFLSWAAPTTPEARLNTPAEPVSVPAAGGQVSMQSPINAYQQNVVSVPSGGAEVYYEPRLTFNLEGETPSATKLGAPVKTAPNEFTQTGVLTSSSGEYANAKYIQTVPTKSPSYGSVESTSIITTPGDIVGGSQAESAVQSYSASPPAVNTPSVTSLTSQASAFTNPNIPSPIDPAAMVSANVNMNAGAITQTAPLSTTATMSAQTAPLSTTPGVITQTTQQATSSAFITSTFQNQMAELQTLGDVATWGLQGYEKETLAYTNQFTASMGYQGAYSLYQQQVGPMQKEVAGIESAISSLESQVGNLLQTGQGTFNIMKEVQSDIQQIYLTESQVGLLQMAEKMGLNESQTNGLSYYLPQLTTTQQQQKEVQKTAQLYGGIQPGISSVPITSQPPNNPPAIPIPNSQTDAYNFILKSANSPYKLPSKEYRGSETALLLPELEKTFESNYNEYISIGAGVRPLKEPKAEKAKVLA